MSEYYKESGFQWIGRIPQMWKIERIKRLVSQKITDGPHETPTLEEEGIPFISAEAIKSEKIDFDKKRGFISLEQHEIYSKKCKPQRNDIFIIKSGATTGNVAFVDTDIEFNIWSPLAVVRCDENKAYYKFVFYQLLSDVFRKQVELSWSFGTQENIGMGVIGRINLVIPSIVEQHGIASYLYKTCAAIDKAIEAKQKQLETLDALRKSIIHKAVTRGLDDSVELKDSGVEWLGRIPRHWKVRRIKDIVALNSGDSIISESITLSGNYPVFGGNGLRGFTTSYTHDGYYVLIGRQGALCGNINYAEGKFWASEHAVVASTLTKHDTFWLGELLRVMNLNQYSNAAAQPGLAVEKIKFLQLPVPSYEEQHRIASFIRGKIVKNEELVSNLQNQISTLEQYRKSLIHECVTGKRRITEDDLQVQL